MAKRATPWKEGKVLSIETRKGIFVLAQMLKEPFIRFYNVFREDENWGDIDTQIFDTLFTVCVVRQFLKLSNVTTVKKAIPDKDRIESDVWLNMYDGSRKVKIWEGSSEEKEFIILGEKPGGSLVKKDLWWSPTPGQPVRQHPSGVIDDVILEDIPLNSDAIDKHELTNLMVYPSLNERLYLCYKLDKNVDPLKDLVFDREIPKEYHVAMEIIATGGNAEEKDRILNTYFI